MREVAHCGRNMPKSPVGTWEPGEKRAEGVSSHSDCGVVCKINERCATAHEARRLGRQGSQSRQSEQSDGRPGVRSVSASLAWGWSLSSRPEPNGGGDTEWWMVMVVVATMGRRAIVMSVNSNKLLLSDTPYKPDTPNTLCAHVSPKCPTTVGKGKGERQRAETAAIQPASASPAQASPGQLPAARV